MYGDGAMAMIEQVFANGIGRAVILLRHSARTYEAGLHDLLNPLTDEGRALCHRFGRSLPKALTLRAYASPAERCLETAGLILKAHRLQGGGATRHRPVEALGVFYVLDQMKMWRGLNEAGGMVGYLQRWFEGAVLTDAMMPAEIAARLVLRVMAGKLSSAANEPQLDLCVSHDMTLHLMRSQLLGEPVDGPKVQYLDGLIAWRDNDSLWLQSQQGAPRKVSTNLDMALPV